MGEDDKQPKPPKPPRLPRFAPTRNEQRTLTDPVELEAARVMSTFTSPPPAVDVSMTEMTEEEVLADYESSLGSFDQFPAIAVSSEEIARFALDPGAEFLLAFIDGSKSIAQVIEESDMPAHQTLAILEDLRARGVVVLNAEPKRRA